MVRYFTLLILCSLTFLYAQELPPVNIEFSSYALSSDGKVIGYYGNKNRVDVKSTGNVSKYVIWCLIATEDRDFYNHDGISLKGLVRGVWKTITGATQGGSTITMQLARNLFLNFDQTIGRKLSEIDLAKKLEKKFSKDQIMLMYLNTVNFGHGVYGIWAAAHEYFCKSPDMLTAAESAALIGLLQSPNGYNPEKNPGKFLKRRNEVLYNLVEVGRISKSEFKKLSSQPLNLHIREKTTGHFLEHVRKDAFQIIKNRNLTLSEGQLRIITTLNSEIQKAAVDAVNEQWNNFSGNMKDAQVGLICIEPGTGMIRSMIGGNPKSEARGLNRSTQIKRQPGSSFKLFLYGKMIEDGLTIAVPLLDSAIVVDSGKGWEWRPQNDDHTFSGKYIPMYSAIQNSVNLAAAYAIANLIEPDSVVNFCHKLGISSRIDPFPSIALGTEEVSPLEITTAASIIASGGIYIKPYSILRIEDKYGNVIYEHKPESCQVLDSADAYLTASVFKNVIDNGTGKSVRKFYKGIASGKTGTTQNSTDAWFVGFNPKLAASIWIGFDSPSRKLTGGYQYGGSACAPIWGKMMAALNNKIAGLGSTDFIRPYNIEEIELCEDSGELASNKCSHIKYYPVNSNKIPKSCHIHDPKERFDIHYGF